jgi:hypothetical protein
VSRPADGLQRIVAMVVGAVSVLLALASQAQELSTASTTRGGPEWQALTPEQRDALAPLHREWAGIDGVRRQKWLEIAARFPSLPPDERNRIHARMEDWAKLSPAERGQARLQFQETRQISPQQRAALWDAYLALPAEQRQALAERAKTVPRAPVAKSGTTTKPAPDRPAAKAGASPTAVAPTLVQARPGASTTLITKSPTPATPPRTGAVPIAVPPEMIDRTTLLPQPAGKLPKPARTAALAASAASTPAAAAPEAAPATVADPASNSDSSPAASVEAGR